MRGLDLLADDDLDPVVGRLGRGLERAGDLVVVGHRDRAQALGARGGEQHLDGGRAVVAVVGVHVQVDVDRGPALQPAGDLGVAADAVAARGERARRAPRARRPPRSTAAAAPPRAGARAGRASTTSRPSCAVSVSRSLGSKSSPASPSPSDLLVDGQARGDWHGAGRLGARDEPGRGGDAVGGGDEHVGARAAPCRRRRRSARARAGRRAAASRTTARARSARRASQRERRVEAAQRAQEEPQGAALLLLDEGDAHRRVVVALGPGERVGAGRDDRVLTGEEAAQQVGGRRVGRGARVEAPEDELHDLARDLRGDDALGRRVEGADVERARVAQGGAGHAGREGLVDVAQVERGALEEVGDRARDVDRQRRPTAAGQRRQRLAHGQHAHLARARARARRRARPCASRARARARTTARRRRRDARAGELVGDPRDERVDVVAVLPRIGGDLGDDSGSGTAGRIVLWRRRFAGAGANEASASGASGPSRSSMQARSSRSMAAPSRSPNRSLSIALVRATAARERRRSPRPRPRCAGRGRRPGRPR